MRWNESTVHEQRVLLRGPLEVASRRRSVLQESCRRYNVSRTIRLHVVEPLNVEAWHRWTS